VKRRLLSAVLVLGLLLVLPAAAQATEADEYKVMSFSVKGTNGFTLKGISSPPPQGPDAALEEEESEGRGELGLWLEHGRLEGATYALDEARVTTKTIEAVLPGVVKISLTRVPTGKHKALHVNCSAAQKLRGKTELDRYVGTIEFHGEEGFTEVEATGARGTFGSVCAIPEGSAPAGKELPGAFLRASRSIADSYQATFGAIRRRPGAPTAIYAEVMEHRGEVEIHRFQEILPPAPAFEFGPGLKAATVRPPAPFSGFAHFAARPGAGERSRGTWTGNLSVDLPGHAGIPLTGRGFRAELFHPTL
jgi:hypothetical protein